jgi:hypothetical protein
MSNYQPAILIGMVENEPSGDEIKGEAVVLIPAMSAAVWKRLGRSEAQTSGLGC